MSALPPFLGFVRLSPQIRRRASATARNLNTGGRWPCAPAAAPSIPTAPHAGSLGMARTARRAWAVRAQAGGPRLTPGQRARSLLSPGAVGSLFAPRPHARASRSQIASDCRPGPMRPRRRRPRRSGVARRPSLGRVGTSNGFWFLTRIWHCLHHDWIPACHRDPFPPQYEFKLLYESLNWAQRASVLPLKTAEVTTGDENTHDFRDALRRPHCREKDANGRALRTVMKAFGGKMARPAPCPAVPRARDRCSPWLFFSRCVCVGEVASAIFAKQGVLWLVRNKRYGTREAVYCLQFEIKTLIESLNSNSSSIGVRV